MENEITMAFENLAISSTKQQQKNVPEPTYSILKTEILASINIIRHKKKKRPDTYSIYTYLLRNYSSNIEKQVIELIVNDLLETKTTLFFFYKHKGYKHIEAENSPKIKHILSMCLGWEKFLSLVIGMVICKIETNEFK